VERESVGADSVNWGWQAEVKKETMIVIQMMGFSVFILGSFWGKYVYIINSPYPPNHDSLSEAKGLSLESTRLFGRKNAPSERHGNLIKTNVLKPQFSSYSIIATIHG
jgi:hypothetical protein